MTMVGPCLAVVNPKHCQGYSCSPLIPFLCHACFDRKDAASPAIALFENDFSSFNLQIKEQVRQMHLTGAIPSFWRDLSRPEFDLHIRAAFFITCVRRLCNVSRLLATSSTTSS